MKMLNLSLYLVLDAAACNNNRQQLLQTAEQSLAAGISFLQLRGHKTLWSKRDWYDTALALKPMCARVNVPFVINDQVDIALAVDADGVHIGQGDLPAAVVRRLLGKDKIIGLSTHSLAEVQAVDATVVDYIGMGPVYPTRSKADAAPALGLELLQQMAAAKTVPGVAIGGINRDRMPAVRRINPDGIAVISAICGQPDIPGAVAGLQG